MHNFKNFTFYLFLFFFFFFCICYIFFFFFFIINIIFFFFFILYFFYFNFLDFLEMNNTSSNSAIIPVFRRGLRRFDIQNKDFILIFIHDLQSWSVSKLWEFLSKHFSNCNEIVLGITKKTHT